MEPKRTSLLDPLRVLRFLIGLFCACIGVITALMLLVVLAWDWSFSTFAVLVRSPAALLALAGPGLLTLGIALLRWKPKDEGTPRRTGNVSTVRIPGYRIRTLMVAVAVMALLFAAWRGAWFLARLIAFRNGI